MGTRIVSRRYDLSPELTSYIEGKVGKLKRYYPNGILDVEVALTQEKLQSTVDIKVDAAGFDVQSAEHAGDIRSAFDIALKKVEHQLKKRKERLWGKKRRQSQRPLKSALAVGEEEVETPMIKKTKLQTMDLHKALKKASQMDAPLVIRSENQKDIRVLYRNELGEIVVLEVE